MKTDKKKYNAHAKRTKEWEKAYYIYENLYMELNTPPALRFGESLTEEEINRFYKEMIDECDYFYPAYLDLGMSKLKRTYEPAKKILDKGFDLLIQIGTKKEKQELFDKIVDNLERLWRWDLIAEYAEKLIELHPRNVDFIDIAAFSYGQIGKEKAIELGQKAVKIAPRNKFYANNLGWIYLLFNHKDKAREMFDT